MNDGRIGECSGATTWSGHSRASARSPFVLGGTIAHWADRGGRVRGLTSLLAEVALRAEDEEPDILYV